MLSRYKSPAPDELAFNSNVFAPFRKETDIKAVFHTVLSLSVCANSGVPTFVLFIYISTVLTVADGAR